MSEIETPVEQKVEQTTPQEAQPLSSADALAQLYPKRPTPQPPADSKKEGAEKPVTPEVKQESKPAQETPAAPAAPAEPTSWIDQLAETPAPQAVPEEVSTWAKSAGIEDVNAFISQAKANQVAIADAQAKAADAEAYKAKLSELPIQLQNAIAKHLAGEDGLAYLRSTPNLDWSKDATAQDKSSLISTYFPGKVTAEDIEAAEDGDDTAKAKIDTYFEMASTKYEAQRSSELGYQKSLVEKREQFIKQRESSVDASIAATKALYPGMAALITPDLRESLVTGEKIADVLYNKDGTFKADAVARIIAAEHFDELLARVRSAAGKQAAEKATKEALERLPENARQVGRTGGTTPTQDNRNPAEKHLAQLFGR